MLLDAYRYKVWADERTLHAIADLERQEHAAPALAFMCQQLNHMVIVEELFIARLLGEQAPHQATNTEVVPSLPALAQRLTACNTWATAYLARSSPAELGHLLTFVFADGQNGAMTREEIFFHLINHGTYHRGAIGHALDLGGGKRPADTYSVFIHGAEPERRQGR